MRVSQAGVVPRLTPITPTSQETTASGDAWSPSAAAGCPHHTSSTTSGSWSECPATPGSWGGAIPPRLQLPCGSGGGRRASNHSQVPLMPGSHAACPDTSSTRWTSMWRATTPLSTSTTASTARTSLPSAGCRARTRSSTGSTCREPPGRAGGRAGGPMLRQITETQEVRRSPASEPVAVSSCGIQGIRL